MADPSDDLMADDIAAGRGPAAVCTCAQCAACLLRALAERPDAIDRICAEPPERLAGLRAPIIERLRSERVTWRAKREERE